MVKEATDVAGVSEAEAGSGEIQDKDFADAFEQASISGDNADQTAADTRNIVKKTGIGEVEKPPETVIDNAENSTAQRPGETDEKFEQRYKTLQGILKHDKESWETEKATLLSQLEEARKPKTPDAATPPPTKAETAAAEAFVDSLTDEQKKQLEEYEQDFDVVSKMEGIKRKVELGKLRKEMEDWKKDVLSQLSAQKESLTPILTKAEENEREIHFNSIMEAHSDFETYRDDGSITKWIESKPKYLQPSLKQAYNNGSAQDVIDLISDFKLDNNIQTLTPPNNVTSIKAGKEAKRQALRSVTNRRGAVNAGMSVAQDFESAFDEASNK